MTTRPLLSYYGSKWRLARHYAPPLYGRIIEPFAGGAGYAQRWADRDVTLVDLDEVLCGVWDYLIQTPAAEILRLPILRVGETVEDHVWSCAEARHLVGYWLNPGNPYPCKGLSSWAADWPKTSYWCLATRAALARNVEQIRHWRVRCGDYTLASATAPATYFIDPPYQGRPGMSYRHDSAAIDYEQLALWCRGLEGQVIVCEAAGADWLPFAPLRSQHGIRGRSVDALCEIGERGGQVNLLEVNHG
jgi:hypothetical protein